MNLVNSNVLRETFDHVPPGTLERLAELFERVDATYAQAAAQCGFECRGCEESCCRTRFYHHTLVEMAYLKQGLAALSTAEKNRVVQRARAQIDKMRRCEATGEPMRAMCPLNHDGRCGLYAQRPMICRLHGVAHLLRRGDGTAQQGPGCHLFSQQCLDPGEARLDRTLYYQQMAALEQSLRRALNFQGRIKLTVAEMVLLLCNGDDVEGEALL